MGDSFRIACKLQACRVKKVFLGLRICWEYSFFQAWECWEYSFSDLKICWEYSFFRPETLVVREGHEGEVRRQSLSENIFCQLEIINTIIMLTSSQVASKLLKALCELRILNSAARLKWRNTIEERTGQTGLQGRNSFLFFLSQGDLRKKTSQCHDGRF